MRAKVQITVEWELAPPGDYPLDTVNSWLEAAAFDFENCIGIVSDGIDLSVVCGNPELVGDPKTEPFRLED